MTSLASGPKHGYALMTDVAEFAGVRLGPGTIYTVLARLEQQGIVEAVESQDRRRPYRLTPAGRARLRDQLHHLRGLVQAGLPHLEET